MATKLTKRQLEEKHQREKELTEFQKSYNEKLNNLLCLLKICKGSIEASMFEDGSLVPVLGYDIFCRPMVMIIVPFSYERDWVLPVVGEHVNHDIMIEYYSMLNQLEEFVTIINARIEKENKIKEIQSKMRETFTKEDLELIGIK